MAVAVWAQGDLADKIKSEVSVILVDIEGTTTPISFVTETLFPYAKDNVQNYLTDNWDDDEVREDVAALRQQSEQDVTAGLEAPAISPVDDDKSLVIQSLVKNVHWQIQNDRKTTALKQLQGHMWRNAYTDGSIKGEVFEDVPPVLKSLKEQEKEIFVYSSGSVEAQKLLFKYSEHGDLTKFFNGYFDTKVGQKRESASYTKIAKIVGKNPAEILFLTDVVAEAAAAETAGFSTCILTRPGNKELSKEDRENYLAIETFNYLIGDDCIPKKRKKTES